MRLIALFVLFSLFFKPATATHIVGGELNYQYLGNDQYKITLKLYRDCNPNVSGQYPGQVHLAIYDTSGILIQQVEMDPVGNINTVPNNANNPCLIVPPNVCVEERIYEIIATLPPINGGYDLVCAFCCRNLSVLNVVTSGNDVGATYISSIPDTLLAPVNNEAYFNLFPPTVICANYPFEFDHSATDIDGDSLVYGLCVLYDNSGGATQPNPPGPPPFPIITDYTGSYTYLNPLGGGLDSLFIDPVTGELTITPPTVGQFVVGISVKEYRNGQFLCEHRRDFQFNVTDCSPTVQAVIIPQPGIPVLVTNCTNFNVDFPNSSTPNSKYHWDFGITNATDDTSNLEFPSFVFPDTGTYTVTLIVNPPGSPCSDTTQVLVIFYPTLTPDMIAPDGCTGNSIQFTDASVATFGTVNNWQWDLGDNSSTTAQNPTHTYTDTGTYTIQLIVETSVGCSDTVESTMQVFTGSINSVFGDTTICKDDIVQIGVDGLGSVTWSPDYGISGINSFTPTVSADSTTMYTVVVISPDGCIDEDSVLVIVYDTLIAFAGPDTVLCPGGSVTLTAGGGLTYAWSPSAGLSNTNSGTTTASPDSSTVYIFTTTVGGCSSTAAVSIQVLPYPTIYLPESYEICPGDSTQLTPVGGTTFSWTPSTGLNATDVQNPWAGPAVTTTYYVTALDASACPITLYDTTVVIVADNTHTLTDDTTIILGTVIPVLATNGATYSWSPPAGLSSTNEGAVIASPEEGTMYYVTITYPDGCVTVDSIRIEVNIEPLVVFPNAFTPNGDGVNPKFRPFIMGLVTVETFRVYDRWGTMVYDGKNLDGWDGKYKGTEQGIGNYAYYFLGKGSASGTAIRHTGNVTLIR